MVKVLKILSITLILFAGTWYFFIKDYDYKITFKTPQATGIIYNTLLGWNNWEEPNNKVVATYIKEPFWKLNQELLLLDSIMDIKWVISKESDSITKVSAYWTDKNNSLIQKLKVPFIKTNFVKRALYAVKRLQKELKELENEYRIGQVEIARIPEQYCACLNLESQLGNKANAMMANNTYIMGYLKDNNIQLVGAPFVEVTNWDEAKDVMTFNFCFPIAYNKNYEDYEDIKFKKTREKAALKTTFNGNYRISDCAWFSLIDYAKHKGIMIERLPTEIFYNDPHSGGNELDWKAEIYMPIKNDKT